MSGFTDPLEPTWTREPTEELLSPRMRAAVVEDLKEGWNFDIMEEYRRNLKASWISDEYYQTIRGPVISDEPIHNFFAHLIEVYPTGPTTIEGIISAHKSIYQKAVSLLEEYHYRKPKEVDGAGPRYKPEKYILKPTYPGILIMMDQFTEPDFDPDIGQFVHLEQEAQKQNVLLVRTGDDSHLRASINFESLRADGLCLPIARSDIPPQPDDVVRVSIATAVKFVSDLQAKEDEGQPRPEFVRNAAQRAQDYADSIIKEADEKGIDNVLYARWAVHSVKAARKGETFLQREPRPFSRHWK